LLGVFPTGFSLLLSQQPAGPEVVVERFKRVSPDEVHLWVKIANKVDQAFFLTGFQWESGPRPFPIYLDQWHPVEGWQSYFCLDMPPPHVIKLNPGDAITEEFKFKLPMSAVCKNPITKLEGRFRFRLEYFESEKQTRAYVKKLFSPSWKEARAPFVVSEPFEIPPPKE